MRHFLKLCAGILLSTSFLVPHARAEKPKLWIQHSLGFVGHDTITNGSRLVQPGFFGSYNVTDLVRDDPAALAMAETALRYNRYSHYAYWLGVIPSAATLGAGLGLQNGTVTWVGAGALLGTLLLTTHFISKNRYHMLGAINHYNGIRPQASSQPRAHSERKPQFAMSYSFQF